MSGQELKAVVFQHHPNISLGNLAPVLDTFGYDVRVVDPTAGQVDGLDPHDADLVIVLGGHEAAYRLDKWPYLEDERRFIRARIDAEKPLLGICLGAQLMAGALGARNYRGDKPDISYRDLELTDAGLESPLGLARGVPMLEWHGDHFELPAEATLLASSEAYPNEAFSIGDFALAVQFHPEVTDEMHEAWIDDSRDQLEREGVDIEWWRAEREKNNAPMQVASRMMFTAWLSDVLRRTP